MRVCVCVCVLSSGAVWESRWPSWAVRPIEPSGFRGHTAILNHASALAETMYASALVSACPQYVNRHPRTLTVIKQHNRVWVGVEWTWSVNYVGISVDSVLSQYTHARARMHTHSHTNWGPRTDGAKSGYCNATNCYENTCGVTQVNMVLNVHKNHKAYYNIRDGGGGEIIIFIYIYIYISLHRHHQNDT